jgi:hypothetical protein
MPPSRARLFRTLNLCSLHLIGVLGKSSLPAFQAFLAHNFFPGQRQVCTSRAARKGCFAPLQQARTFSSGHLTLCPLFHTIYQISEHRKRNNLGSRSGKFVYGAPVSPLCEHPTEHKALQVYQVAEERMFDTLHQRLEKLVTLNCNTCQCLCCKEQQLPGMGLRFT